MNRLEEKQQKVYNMSSRPIRRKQQSVAGSFFRSFLTSLLIMFVFMAIIYRTDLKNTIASITGWADGTSRIRAEFTLPFSAKRQNILVAGVDVSDNRSDPFKGTRTDSMFLVSIAPYGRNVNVISIPRDSKVYIGNNTKPDKINHAFAHGGINLTIKTVENTFGVRINHYLVVSNEAIIKFIDTIGGLPIYVEQDMRYHDYSAGLHIDLTRGEQTLNGAEAEGYLRYRKDALGDIGRIRRQQWFMNALMSRLKEPAVLVKIPEALKTIPKYIQTDLSVYEMTQYAALAKNLDSSTIQVATLPGSPSQRGDISYWILDAEKTQNVINRLVYRDKPQALQRALSVGILYSSAKENSAKDLKAQLEQNGFEVNIQNREKLGYGHIAIHNMDVPQDIILGLKKAIPEMKEKQTVYDSIGFNRVGKDFTIILSGS